jgi:hypothetical protein
MVDVKPRTRALYLVNRLADLRRLRASSLSDQIKIFHDIGHKVSGTALSFGYPDLEQIAHEMLALSDKSQPETAAQIGDRLGQWLDRQKSTTEPSL